MQSASFITSGFVAQRQTQDRLDRLHAHGDQVSISKEIGRHRAFEPQAVDHRVDLGRSAPAFGVIGRAVIG